MSGDNSDNALMMRLNALRKSHVSLDSSPKLHSGEDKPKQSQSSDLQARFTRLSSPAAAKSIGKDLDTGLTPHNVEDDKFLDELLKDLGMEDQWALDHDDEKDVKSLTAEARGALATVSPQSQFEQENMPKDGEVPAGDVDDEVDHETTEQEDREVDEIIAQVMAELEIEHQAPLEPWKVPHDDDGGGGGSGYRSEEREGQAAGESSLELPSAPTKLKNLPGSAESGDETCMIDEYLASRLSGLSLPTAPSVSPTRKPTKARKSNLPTFSNEEMDSWCIICNDDAQVKCLGCDGDLYCSHCWNEGHRGPDVGFEEKRHRCEQYELKKKKRSLAGA